VTDNDRPGKQNESNPLRRKEQQQQKKNKMEGKIGENILMISSRGK